MKYSRLPTLPTAAFRYSLAYLLLAVCLSQTVSAAELSITSNQLPLRLGPYLDFYEDETANLTIADVLAEPIPWQRSEQSIPTMGISTSAFWFLIELTTRESIDEALVLSSAVPVVDRLDYYIVVNGELVQSSAAGDTVPYSSLDFPYRIPVVPFDLAPVGETTAIYIRAVSTSGVEMPVTLSTVGMLAAEQQGQLTFFGAFFTFFFISFCLCAFYYYNMRDKEFLGYTLFFATALPFFLSQTGMGRVWFWGDLGTANNRIGYLSAVGLIVSMCVLGQALGLKTRHRYAINLVLRYVSYLMIPAALFFLFTPLSLITSETVLLVMGIGFSAAASVVVLSGITAAQGSRTALYLFMSWSLIILAYSTLLSFRFTLIERTAFTPLVGEWLMVLAALTLLASMFEFIRSKNEEMVQFKLETQAKGDFLRNVSREFLTPVHLILANSKRLLSGQPSSLDEATREHLDTVIKQSDHLHNLINDLLEMAELESDSFEPEFELVEMSHFLSEIRDILLPSAMEKGLEFKTTFASANLLVQTDVARLQHALINIITNAIRFTESGEIKLGYKAVYYRRRLGIEIFISDTGRGMSEEFQQRMFKEFSQEEPSSEKEPQGTGLGMVIVKRMIEKLGGEISFESKRGEGSEFFIRLPLRIHAN